MTAGSLPLTDMVQFYVSLDIAKYVANCMLLVPDLEQ